MLVKIGHKLQFHCQSCRTPLLFSVLERKRFREPICCGECGKKYLFDDTLLAQLEQFEALCCQIHASEEILGETSIAIDVGKHHVKVPFNILLTRLSSVIELEMGDEKILISFRIEPLRDIPEVLVSQGSSSFEN